MAQLMIALPGTTPAFWRALDDDRLLATIIRHLTAEDA